MHSNKGGGSGSQNFTSLASSATVFKAMASACKTGNTSTVGVTKAKSRNDKMYCSSVNSNSVSGAAAMLGEQQL